MSAPSSPGPLPPRVLVLRVLSLRDAPPRVRASVSASLGGATKHAADVMVTPATAPATTTSSITTTLNEELVFPVSTGTDAAMTTTTTPPPLDLALNLVLTPVAAGRTGAFRVVVPRRGAAGAVVQGGVVLAAGRLAEEGGEGLAAWVPVPGTNAQIKISLFWRGLAAPAAAAAAPPQSPSLQATATPGSITHLAWMPDSQYQATGATRAKLAVTVHQCRGLRAVNLTNRSSDPYVAVAVRGSRSKTKVYQGNLNPVFEEKFQFGDAEDLDDEDQLSLVVMDWNRIGKNTELGWVLLNLGELRGLLPLRRWYRLESTTNENYGPGADLGWIEVSVDYRPSSGGGGGGEDAVSLSPSPPSLLGRLDSDNQSPRSPIPGNISSSSVSSGTAVAAPAVFTKPHPRLCVRVVQARNLMAADSDGKSDPYVVVRVNGEEKRTPVRRKTLCPVWDAEFTFGAGPGGCGLLTPRDVVEVSVVDWDPGLVGDLADDALGGLRVPIWSVMREAGEPKWYSLRATKEESAPQAQGEVQLAWKWVDPEPEEKQVDIYKGKVWKYELQVTLLEARDLMIRDVQTKSSDPFCVITCGAEQFTSQIVMRNRNPIWNQRFRFRKRKALNKGGGEDTAGLGRTDTLTVDVRDYDGPGQASEGMGSVTIDLAWLIDKLGYIDPSGKALIMEFPLEAPSDVATTLTAGIAGGGEDDDDDATAAAALEAASSAPPSSPSRPASSAASTLMSRFAAGAATSRGLLSRFGSTGGGSTSSATAGSGSAPTTTTVPPTDTPDTFGRIKLRLRLTPIAESRHAKKGKLILRLGEAKDLNPVLGGGGGDGSVPPPPCSFVYATVKVGFDVLQTPLVPARWYMGGRPVFNSTLLFVDGMDYKLSKAQELKKSRDKETLRLRQEGALAGAVNTDEDPDAVRITICDEEGATLAVFRSTASKLLSDAGPVTLSSIATPGSGSPPQLLRVSAALDTTREELVPLLGHINLRLLSLKLKDKKLTLKESLRCVVRYAGKRLTTRVHFRDPNPVFSPDEGTFQFPVYNPHDVVVVELWDVAGVSSALGARMDMVRNFAGRMFGGRSPPGSPSPSNNNNNNTPPPPLETPGSSGGGGGGGGEESLSRSSSAAGVMVGSVTLSLFDLYELEAQVVFGDDAVLKRPTELATKLPVRDRHGKVKASLWLEAAYDENTWGVLASNPNPPVLKGKPYSLTNFRHEINRLFTILGWASALGARVSRLMNWQSTPNTVAVLVIIAVFCTVDWLSSRFLVLIPLCLLMHIANRHAIRRNGEFLSQFEDDDRDEDARAEMRVACVEVSLGGGAPLSKVKARLSLVPSVKDPSKKTLHVGSTMSAPVTMVEGHNPYADLSTFSNGYQLASTASVIGSTLQTWKYDVEELPVPCFDFRVPNEVVNEALLMIVVHEARGIMAADATGKSDPFVRIHVNPETGGETFKTSIISQTLDPVWNQEFVAGGKIPLVSSGTVEFRLFDDDGLMKSSEPLGSVQLGLPAMDDEGDGAQPAAITQLTCPRVVSRDPTWYKILPPPGGGGGGADFGELCVSMHWLDTRVVPRSSHRQERDGASTTSASASSEEDGEAAPPSTAEEASDLAESGGGGASGTSGWTRNAAYAAVDVYEVSRASRQRFLGRARIPTAALVASDDVQVQDAMDAWVGLDYKYDGSPDDSQLRASGGPRGEVHVVAMVTLPDPKLEEKRLAMNEAKRTEKLNPIQKLFVIERKLRPVQEALFQVNNRLERLKNLFNWAHPRRTQWMVTFMLILVAIFVFIPSRFFILMTVLFFFTERFRPMGTMGARFKHLLSQLPTDDELKRMVRDGSLLTAKRRPAVGLGVSSRSAAAVGLVQQVQQQQQQQVQQQQGSPSLGSTSLPVAARRSVGASRASSSAAAVPPPLRPGVSNTSLRGSEEGPSSSVVLDEAVLNISLTEAYFSGHMFISAGGGGDTTYARKFFACSRYGLHHWSDQDSAEAGREAPTSIPNLRGVEPGSDPTSLSVTTHDGARYAFVCSSPSKRDTWITVLRGLCVVVEPWQFEKRRARRTTGQSGGGASGRLASLRSRVLASIGSSGGGGIDKH